ncbi:baseplate J/gp47 family protein [Sediminispirochaeta bajacaliforniensis]|uniref:baseplate J/gp47 family protein n=1 Tax=Sediminispirochaeta bajacaliforniensis TaxID=148 RepID=UPI000362146D|nr:baseplate J/gp47 family protein [Sediminispirochaeta bajacaliforniensis]
MDFERPSISNLQDRIENDYKSRFTPLSKTVRYDLLTMIGKVDAGIYHQLYGNLVYLARQIFPDTASSDNLRAHWSDRVPILTAQRASGMVQFSGSVGRSIPAGILLEAPNGQEYYLPEASEIGDEGVINATVKASTNGSDGNQDQGTELTIISNVPKGIEDTTIVLEDSITGGVDAESDDEYLIRVLNYIRNSSRYGKPGDFAAWAIDASIEVEQAWEFKNYGPFGALLIQVAGGNHETGLSQVVDLDIVSDYIYQNAPPVLYTVKTPDIIYVNPSIELISTEDTESNRNTTEIRIKSWMALNIKPGSSITSYQLRDAIVDGTIITDASVTLETGSSTILQLLDLGDINWL